MALAIVTLRGEWSRFFVGLPEIGSVSEDTGEPIRLRLGFEVLLAVPFGDKLDSASLNLEGAKRTLADSVPYVSSPERIVWTSEWANLLDLPFV